MGEPVLWHERVLLAQTSLPSVGDATPMAGFSVAAMATPSWFVVDTIGRSSQRVHEVRMSRIVRAEVEGWSAERSEYGWRWTTGLLHGPTVRGATTGLTLYRDDGRWVQFRIDGPPAAVRPRVKPFLSALGFGSAPAGGSLPPPTPAASDVTSQLSQLAALRDSGALTGPEFEAAKQRVLGARARTE